MPMTATEYLLRILTEPRSDDAPRKRVPEDLQRLSFNTVLGFIIGGCVGGLVGYSRKYREQEARFPHMFERTIPANLSHEEKRRMRTLSHDLGAEVIMLPCCR